MTRTRDDSTSADASDHVDRVVAQWRAHRPDLDLGPFAIVGRLGRAAALNDRAIEQFFAEHGLSRALWDVLASLRREGPPYRLSPTQLYRGLMRTSGTMTNRLTQLQRAGLIRRVPDPADGRGLLVELTRKGVRLVDRLAGEHMENERRLLAGLTADEQDELAGLLRQMLGHLERTRGI
jgi:DNA-binding MarR family transcriptional regulator